MITSLKKTIFSFILIVAFFLLIFGVSASTEVQLIVSSSGSINLSSSIETFNNIIYATSGSNTAIQSAVNSANSGDVVIIPEGTYVFDDADPWTSVKVPAGVSILGSYSNGEWNTVLEMSWEPSNGNCWFEYSGSSSHLTRFSGLKLVGYREFDPSSKSMTSGISIKKCNSQIRIDHNDFRNLAGMCIEIKGGRGVIDHNNFSNYPTNININGGGGWDDLTSWYAISVNIMDTMWTDNIVDLAGKYTSKTWFVENNFFDGYYSPATIGNANHLVFRYNTVKNCVQVHNHHANYASNPRGGQFMETYNNHFTATSLDQIGVQISSGGGLIFNNTAVGYGIDGVDDYAGFVQLRQYQPDSWGIKYQVHNVWIWNNNLTPGSDLLDIHAPEIGSNPIIFGIDYWLNFPTQFNYVPYVYPHPLVV